MFGRTFQYLHQIDVWTHLLVFTPDLELLIYIHAEIYHKLYNSKKLLLSIKFRELQL